MHDNYNNVFDTIEFVINTRIRIRHRIVMYVLHREADMWLRILTYSSLASGLVALAFFNKFISKGEWVVERTDRCDNPEIYPYDIDLHKKKVNRTHDGFSIELNFLEDLTEDEFGVMIEACKKVDGGCRPVVQFADDSFCRFLTRNAKRNFYDFLRNIGVDEKCPIPKGHHKLNNFLFDNREIPEEGMVGEFMSTITILKQDVKMACFVIHVHFEEKDDDDDE